METPPVIKGARQEQIRGERQLLREKFNLLPNGTIYRADMFEKRYNEFVRKKQRKNEGKIEN